MDIDLYDDQVARMLQKHSFILKECSATQHPEAPGDKLVSDVILKPSDGNTLHGLRI